jgi:osmotically-inducible protein OsmY
MSLELGSKQGGIMDNNMLKTNVESKILWELGVNADGVIVEADEGIVTLSGTVPSFYEKIRIENVVKKLWGVKGVANEIFVDIDIHLKRNDKELTEAAVSAIEWDISLPKDVVKISVSRGVITLTGEVDFDFQKTRAYDDVHSLYGVVNVVNAITLKSPITVDSKTIEKEIEREFQRSAVLHAHKIKVRTEGKKVYLSGAINSWFEYNEAQQAALTVPGVLEVQNDLYIQ